ncbi:MAG: redox-regulated ATPase YchF [Oscillospiraceae bacterium]|nr:redox-regulated ATPase YchF [Oscillospiraceae bacterium]
MKLGMVGLPNVGKSTLFNALTNSGAEAANYPFCTIEPNVGMVNVPDKRIDALSKIYSPDKITPAFLEFVDIAGLVKGASKGEGLGNKFLSNIREVDAIVHVVRCFEDIDIIHVDGDIGASRDIEVINLELIFSDIEIVDRRIEKTKKLTKSDKKYVIELDLFEKLKLHLESGLPARSFESGDNIDIMKSISLLSNKPIIYAANMCEEDFKKDIKTNKEYKSVCMIAEKENSCVLPICAKLEEEISSMDYDDKQMFLNELKLEQSGLDRIIREGYSALGLISYLTAGKQEVRAWTIEKGTKAPQAAGKIHTDFEKGFIRAEIVSYLDFIECGGMVGAKDKGLVRLEGKEYIVKDGDIILFRFNV